MAKTLVSLPIDARIDEIMSLLDDRQVVIVEAETGAGKTTRLPQAWLSSFTGPVVMTQTRRAAVRWNGRRIADELGCKPGELVGWRLRGERPMVSPATRLVLMMDQSLVNRIQRERKLPPGLIIVDEAHERSVSIDLLLGLIKQYLPTSPDTKVIITSATIDTEKFSRYYDGAPVITVKGRVFPVSTEVLRMEKYEHHSQGASRAAELVLKRFLNRELLTPTEDGKGTQIVSSGTVLVLLPGKDDITSVMSYITHVAKAANVSDQVQVMACYGESTPEEQDAIQAPVPEGTLRFVCGTVVLRNSVTVRYTVGVIDSLQVKRLVVTPQGAAHLAKVTVSRAEASQAKGRAGRMEPGFYFPVSFGREYETLDPYPQPAILREPIAHVVLQVAAAGLDVRTFEFIDRPSEEHIEAAIRRLRRVGALDEREEITEIGRTLLQFPIDPERAKALLTGRDLGVLPETVIALAVLDVEGIFHRPKEQNVKVLVDEAVARQVLRFVKEAEWGWTHAWPPRSSSEVDLSALPEWAVRRGDLIEINCGAPDFPNQEGARWIADIIRRQWADGSQSDFVAIVRAYRAFKTEERRLQQAKASRLTKPGTKREPSRETQLRDWCMRHSVNFKRLRMAENVMREIREELANSSLGSVYGLADEREFDTQALTTVLASGMLDNLATACNPESDRYSGPIGQFTVGRSSASRQAPMVLVGGVSKITSRRGVVFYLADLAAPVDRLRLIEVIPELIEVKAGLNPRYDTVQDEVTSDTETWFNNRWVETIVVLDPDHAEAARLRREGRNVRQWQNWTDRPEIVLPDPADDTAVIPEIVVCTYGADAETGEPLAAYGTIAPYGYRYHSFDPWFKILWTRDKNEAERSRQESIDRLEFIRAEVERQRNAAEVERLRRAAEPLRAQMASLLQTHGYNCGLPKTLCNRMSGNFPHTSDPEVMRQWMVDAEALVVEVKSVLTTIEAHKVEVAAKLDRLTETAKSLRDQTNGLLAEKETDLSDELYYQLVALDVDDDRLPTTNEELSEWVTQAKAVIDKANGHLARLTPTPQGGVSDAALEALAQRFSPR